MTTQTQQDIAIKRCVDVIAKDRGYQEGTLDSEKGTLTYDISTPVFGKQEALNRILFRNQVSAILQHHKPNMTISSSLGILTIKLPDWDKI